MRTNTSELPLATGGSIEEMLGGIPGGPISDMLDEDLLTEVWE